MILAGAVLFGVPTLLLKQFKSAESRLPRLLRAFAGGVVLALALVHIIPEVSHASWQSGDPGRSSQRLKDMVTYRNQDNIAS